MLKNKLLLIGTLPILFSTSIVAVETDKCDGGVCFVDLNKHKPSKAFKKDNQPLMIEKPRYLDNDDIDKSATIVLDGKTITVFPKSSYVMSKEEQKQYNIQEEPLLIVEENLEEIILDEVKKLPNSEYFCEENSKPVIHSESGFYECV
jgi:hypothetical protein